MVRQLLYFTFFIFLASCIEPGKVKNKQEIVKKMAITIEKQFPTIEHLPVESFLTLSKNEYILIDTRTEDEQKVSMIPSAITLNEFKSSETKYKDKKLVFYCTIGYRSSKVAVEYQDKGFKVFNLKQSALGWAWANQEFESNKARVKKLHVYSEAWNFLPESYIGVFDE